MKISLMDKEGMVLHQCYLIDDSSFLSFCSLAIKVENYTILNHIRDSVSRRKLFHYSIGRIENALEENVVNIKDFIVEIIKVTDSVEDSSLSKEHEYFIYTLSQFLVLAMENRGRIILSSSYEIH